MATRRIAGILLILAGIALCAVAGWHYLHGYLAQRQAHATFAERLATPAVPSQAPQAPPQVATQLAQSAPPTPQPTPAYPYGQPIARLRIPVARIDQIVFGGSDEATLEKGPGHVPGTALPGTDGPPYNCVITGHRDSHFRRLGWLKPGNVVELDTPSGEATYRIVQREVVKPDAVSVMAPTREPRLTLITCYPFTYIGPAPERLVLIAEPTVSRAARHGS